MEFKVSKEDKNKTGVYCITNKINNKIYIGSTSTSFYLRYHQHKSDYFIGKKGIRILYRAFDKYGITNFVFKIVEITTKENCIKREQYYINKGTDYNCAKVAGSLLGLKHHANAKTRTIIKGEHHCAVSVDKYSLDGKYIETFTSIIGACEATGIKSKSNIVQCCKGNVFSARKFRWSYTGNPLINRIDKRILPFSEERIIKMSKPRGVFKESRLIAYDFTLEKDLIFESVSEASKELNILKTSIINNINGLSNKCNSKLNKHKYKFRYEE